MKKDLSFIRTLPPAKQQAILQGPAMKPPPGTIPNFAHPPNKNDVGYGVTITSLIICTFFVAIRLYTRAVYHKKVGIEDALAAAALGAFAGFIYCVYSVLLNPGVFVHQWDVRVKDLPHIFYYMSLGWIMYGLVITCLKSGILLEWSRVFVPRGIRNPFWWTCWSVLVVNFVFYFISTFLEIFSCNPRQKVWDITLPGKCMDVPTINIIASSLNLAIDTIILLLPQKVIWSLQISLQKKIGVAMLFAVGIFGCVSAGVRIRSTVNFVYKPDMLYAVSDLVTWYIAEMASGFLVLCIPTIPKLLTDSPWIRAIVLTFKSFSSSSSFKQTSDPSANPPTIGQWKRPRSNTRSLFTNSDKSDFVPLTDVSVTSVFKVESGPNDSNTPTHKGEAYKSEAYHTHKSEAYHTHKSEAYHQHNVV